MNSTPRKFRDLASVFRLFKLHRDKSAGPPMHIRRRARSRVISTPNENPWRAAAIDCGEDACEAARFLDGKRLLLRDVPLIPLRECNMSRCECKYHRYKDRRGWEGDRRSMCVSGSGSAAVAGSKMLRSGPGRRADD